MKVHELEKILLTAKSLGMGQKEVFFIDHLNRHSIESVENGAEIYLRSTLPEDFPQWPNRTLLLPTPTHAEIYLARAQAAFNAAARELRLAKERVGVQD